MDLLLLLTLAAAGTSASSPDESDSSLPFERIHSHDAWEWHLSSTWHSRYFSEGRDNLDGDSLVEGVAEVGWNHLSLGLWYGDSPDQAYNEWQGSAALTQTWDGLEVYLAYTHLRLPDDGEDDDEIGVGLAWHGLPLEVGLTVDAYRSFGVDGNYWELGLHREVELAPDWSLEPTLTVGINDGYVADGHDGADHLALSLGLTRAVSDSLSLHAHVTRSWELDRDDEMGGDELLVDSWHVGLGVRYTF